MRLSDTDATMQQVLDLGNSLTEQESRFFSLPTLEIRQNIEQLWKWHNRRVRKGN